MGIREDYRRFKKIGKKQRQDLTEFIKKGDLVGNSDSINIPIKIVDLPEFAYSSIDMGGVGQGKGENGQPKPGQPVGKPQKEDGDGDEPGDESGEHGYYDMDPEEFAKELEKELELPEMEPKGKKVKEENLGAYKERARNGPRANLDMDHLFKKGVQRAIAGFYDEEYIKEALKVKDQDLDSVYRHILTEKNYNIPFSKLKMIAENVDDEEIYNDFEELDDNYTGISRFDIVQEAITNIEVSPEDERYKHPEIKREYEKNAVVVNIRDCSGSMGEKKRDLIKRVFVPLDWYLQGKYENAEFVYIAHDHSAEEVQRNEFFTMKSSGGTRVSSAYEVAKEILDEKYPWSEWNRYVFAGGDGENYSDDTVNKMVPLMEDIDANYHAYVQVKPNGKGYADLASDLEEHYSKENLAVSNVESADDIMFAIYNILSKEGGGE